MKAEVPAEYVSQSAPGVGESRLRVQKKYIFHPGTCQRTTLQRSESIYMNPSLQALNTNELEELIARLERVRRSLSRSDTDFARDLHRHFAHLIKQAEAELRGRAPATVTLNFLQVIE
jgi:hypothetical protein